MTIFGLKRIDSPVILAGESYGKIAWRVNKKSLFTIRHISFHLFCH